MVSGFPAILGGSEYIIFKKALEEELKFEKVWNDELKDLVLKMIVRDPEERYDLNKIKEHKFFEGYDFENLKTWEEVSKESTNLEQFLEVMKTKLENTQLSSKEEIALTVQKAFDDEMTEEIEKDESLNSWKEFFCKRIAHLNKIEEFEY